MDNEFESLLKSDEAIVNTKIDDVKIIKDTVNEDIDSYNKLIGSFFVGKENGIKQIYNSIRNNSFPFNKVSVLDINFIINTYLDYFDGMVEFVNKVVDLNNRDDVSNESVLSTINKVNDKDSNFIESLFGGERCSKSPVDISTAMLNIEKLIDIDEDFILFKNTTSDLYVKVESNNECDKYKNEIILALNVYLKSIRLFIKKCVVNILETYDEIMNSLQKRTPANGVNEVPKYQIF